MARPGQVPGEPHDDHADSREHRLQRLEPDPGQLGGLEADQPGAGGHRQLAGMPAAAPLPPPGQQKTATDQPG
jgi:hypothetical protein